MPRKKKPPSEIEKAKGVLQDAQDPNEVSSQELETILKQVMKQFGSQTSGSSQPQQPTKLKSSTSPQGSSTPSGSQDQKIQDRKKASEQTLDSYIKQHTQKQIPEKNWQQVLRSSKQIPLAIVPQAAITKQEYDQANQLPASSKAGLVSSQNPKSVTTTSSQEIVISAKTPPSLDTPFIPKLTQIRNLVQIEPEFWDPNPSQVARNMFPTGFHFRATDLRKNRQFYELILVHSESAKIIHEPPNEPILKFSKLQILKVLTPPQWGQDPNKLKYFGEAFDKINFEPRGYNYWDYVDAWHNVFWYQNESFKHTWFIYFKNKTKYIFPQWFAHWWKYYGPELEILPPKVVQALELFKQKFNLGEDPFPVDLHYFSKLAASWIFSWQYRFSQSTPGSTLLPILQRLSFSRWWARYETSRIEARAVEGWFKENPQHLCMTEQTKFLNQKSRVQTILAATSDKASMVNQLNALLQALQESEQTSSASPAASSSELPNNEDEDEDYVVDLGDD